ncbi:MAG: hypothetical protein Q7J32_10770 [Sphingomonadaceae bacterium]|nr:hypothetical protein [Sphingomonadaceae bacterium]
MAAIQGFMTGPLMAALLARGAREGKFPSPLAGGGDARRNLSRYASPSLRRTKMKRRAFGLLLSAGVASAQGAEPFREIGVEVEYKRDGTQLHCRFIAPSKPDPETANEACDAVEFVSADELQRSVVRIWRPPAYEGVVVKPTARKPRSNYLTTDDRIDRFNGRTPAHVAVVYLINADGLVERCMPRISTTPSKLAAEVCRILTKRFRFNPATLDGTAIAYPSGQGFFIPGRFPPR